MSLDDDYGDYDEPDPGGFPEDAEERTGDEFSMDDVLDALDAEVESFVEDVVEGGYE